MQPPQFNNIPLLGQRQQQAQAQLNAAIGQLAMQIYSHAAIHHVTTRDIHQPLDPETLHRAAKDSIRAAECYFEGIGVIRKGEQE